MFGFDVTMRAGYRRSFRQHLLHLLTTHSFFVIVAVSSQVLILTALGDESTVRPNIVIIITDDQGYPPIARLGHPWIRTPHLDALHDASTRFNKFLVCPTCSPTRSALVTGRHSMRNGVTHTILERERLTLDAVTLPQVLTRVGTNPEFLANGTWEMKNRINRIAVDLTMRSFTELVELVRHTIAVVLTSRTIRISIQLCV